MREGGRLKKKERERRESETDVPKLYPTMNMNSLCVAKIIGCTFQVIFISILIKNKSNEMVKFNKHDVRCAKSVSIKNNSAKN